VFEKADVDHSGSIDFVEFLDFMCRIKTEDRVEFNFLMESTIDKKSCVQLFKDTAKLSTFISPDVIMASTFMWWLNKLFVQLQLRIPEKELKIRSRFSHKDILMCSYKKQTPDEFNEWKQHLTRGLPPYHVLCRLVANGIHGYFCCCDCCGVFSRLLYVVAFFPPVHLCTSIGRSIWYVVGKKYYYYVLACAGIWVDGCVKGYDLDNASKISISEHVDASADQHHAHEDLSDQEIQAKLHRKDHDDFSPLKGKGGMVDRHEMGEVIRMIVAPRAVLLQVIPQLTPLSIYAEIMADSPLFIPSKRAQAFFSDLLIRDALEMSRAKEMSEANHTLRAFERGVEWIVRIRSINVYISESRLFKIVKNLFLFLFSLGVLYSDPAWWISLSMIILFPLLFIGLLDLYVMTGKFVGITDDDVSIFLPSKYSSVLKEVPVGKIDDDSGDRVVAPLSVDPESVDVEIPVVQATTVPTKTNKGMKIDDHLASLASLAKQGIIDQEHYSRAKASLMTDLQRG